MSKVKFVLDPAPTFKATVDIPVHGGEPAPVGFVFKHRTRDELDEFFKSISQLSVEESVLECVVGWDLDDEFNAENVARLCQNYLGAPGAISQAYATELFQRRLGN